MRLRFRPDVTCEEFSEQTIILKFPHVIASWKNPTSVLKKRIRCLLDGSSELYDEESEELPNLFYFLENLKKSVLLSHSVMREGKIFATLTPHHNGTFELQEKVISLDVALQISRFAFSRRMNDAFIIESPVLSATIMCNDSDAVLLFSSLSVPKKLKDLITEFPHIPEDTITHFYTLLYRTQLLSDVDSENALNCWEFHDLLFHTKSRRRNESPSGGTFRFFPEISPLPALRPEEATMISLFKPDILEGGPTFIEVIERRKSIREQGKNPITKDQLGEFLYRSARVKEMRHVHAKNYEATSRPYPGGGACYELELYPVVHRCNGLERGMYRYHPDTHALYFVSEEIEPLLKGTPMNSEYPQVLILIAARFQRVSWKYESMAYSLILKNTGVLMQTMYLTATAMNLAPCALGAGNSDLFAKAAKTNYYEETTVGEFILGSI